MNTRKVNILYGAHFVLISTVVHERQRRAIIDGNQCTPIFVNFLCIARNFMVIQVERDALVDTNPVNISGHVVGRDRNRVVFEERNLVPVGSSIDGTPQRRVVLDTLALRPRVLRQTEIIVLTLRLTLRKRASCAAEKHHNDQGHSH